MIRDLRQRWRYAQAERRLARKVPSWRYAPRITIISDVATMLGQLAQMPPSDVVVMHPANMRALKRGASG